MKYSDKYATFNHKPQVKDSNFIASLLGLGFLLLVPSTVIFVMWMFLV